MILRLSSLFFVGCLVASSTGSIRAERANLSHDIAKILLDHCQGCHGNQKAEGGYRVNTFELAVSGGDSGSGFVGGNLDESEAYRRIVSEDPSERMPLDRDPLSKMQVALVEKWIKNGAKVDSADPKSSMASIVARTVQPPAPIKYRFPVPITSLHFTADGGQLLVGGYHEITVWNPVDKKLIRRIPNVGQRTLGMDLAEDGKTLVVVGGTPGKYSSIRVIDIESGVVRKVFGVRGDLIQDVELSPNEQRIATVSAEGTLQVYDSTGTSQQLSLASHSDWVTAVCWSPDGSKIATASRDKTCKVIDAKTGELLTSYAKHGKPVRDLVFHSSGEEIFSAGSDNKVHRWKIADAKKISEWAFADEVYRVVRSEEILFATSADKTMRQFDPKANKETRQYIGHANRVISVDFHAQTNRIASGGIDGEIRIWNRSDGKLIARFHAAPGAAGTTAD